MIQIRKLTKLSEFRDTIELEKIIWRLDDYYDCIPEHVLLVWSETGGLVLGAYSSEKMVGFLCTAPGLDRNGNVFHYSYILGILPEYRGQDIAFQLKLSHYKLALEMGIRTIEWTYDPLLGVNASLNIAKLGCFVYRYKQNVYGEDMGGSKLIGGVPTDRFICTWEITTKHVKKKLSSDTLVEQPGKLDLVNKCVKKDDVQLFQGFDPPGDKGSVFVEIPEDFQYISDNLKEIATDWRLGTRELFESYFGAGYFVKDFFRMDYLGIRRNLYILERK